MRSRFLLVAWLLALVAAAAPATAPARMPIPLRALEIPGNWVDFQVAGSHGYEIEVVAYSERLDGKGGIGVMVTRKGPGAEAAAFYSTDAVVTWGSLDADLGKLGRVHMAVSRSGRQKVMSPRCSHAKFDFEPAVLEGEFEFRGEGGYTGVRATKLPLRFPYPSFCGGGGSGEARGPGLPGARIHGLSFAHDRALSFQLNKNGRHARTLYRATLKERPEGIWIYRSLKGIAPGRAFRFGPRLRSATVAPPPPFSGSATLSRDAGALFPRWGGDLALEFPGRTVSLTGPAVHVSISHAHLEYDNDGAVEVGF